MEVINIKVDSSWKNKLSDGVLDVDELNLTNKQKQALANGTAKLSVVFEEDSGIQGEAVTLDLKADGFDVDYLSINDQSGIDLLVVVDDSDGLIVDRSANGVANTDSTSNIGSINLVDNNEEGKTFLSSILNVSLQNISSNEDNDFLIINDISVNDNVNISSSAINISGSTNISQEGNNLDQITNVNFDVSNAGNSEVVTDVNYDVYYNNQVEGTTEDLATMQAGTYVKVNQTGGNFNTTGVIENIVHSVLGDSQSEAFVNQLQGFSQLNKGVTFTWNDVDYTANELIGILSNSNHSLHESLLSSIVDGKNSKTPVIMNSYNEQTAVNTNVQETATQSTTTTTTTITKPILTVKDNDVYALTSGKHSSSTSTDQVDVFVFPPPPPDPAPDPWSGGGGDGGGPGGDGGGDPVAVIHFQNLGGTGNILAVAENTADIRDFVGASTIATDNNAGSANITSFIFETGVKVDNQNEQDSVTSVVTQDINAVLTQTGRDGVNVEGGVYNQAGKQLDGVSSTYNTGGLNEIASLFNSNSFSSGSGVIDQISTFLQNNTNVKAEDVTTWNDDFIQLLLDQGVIPGNTQVNQLVDKYKTDQSVLVSGLLDGFLIEENSTADDVANVLMRTGYQLNSQAKELVASFVLELEESQDRVLGTMVDIGTDATLADYMDSNVSSLLVDKMVSMKLANERVSNVLNACVGDNHQELVSAVVGSSNYVIQDKAEIFVSITNLNALNDFGKELLDTNQLQEGLNEVELNTQIGLLETFVGNNLDSNVSRGILASVANKDKATGYASAEVDNLLMSENVDFILENTDAGGGVVGMMVLSHMNNNEAVQEAMVNHIMSRITSNEAYNDDSDTNFSFSSAPDLKFFQDFFNKGFIDIDGTTYYSTELQEALKDEVNSNAGNSNNEEIIIGRASYVVENRWTQDNWLK